MNIHVITLSHGKANALDVELLEQLRRELTEAASSPARAVILTGTGRIFCAGVDLHRVVREGEAYVRWFLPLLSDVFRQLFTFPKPIIAAVNGHAIAGGCVMTLASDYRIAVDDNCRIGLSELLVGVPFPPVALEIIRFAVPARHLQQVVYFGRGYESAEAKEIGLIDEIVPAAHLMERAQEAAVSLGGLRTEAFRLTKRHLRHAAAVASEFDPAMPVKVADAWCDPGTLKEMGEYLERVTRKKG